jgi:hypothetical protein
MCAAVAIQDINLVMLLVCSNAQAVNSLTVQIALANHAPVTAQLVIQMESAQLAKPTT